MQKLKRLILITPSKRKEYYQNRRKQIMARQLSGLCHCGELAKYGLLQCERHLSKARDRNAELRWMAIQYLGGICECCGEKNHKFLTIDHINNNGAELRARGWTTAKTCREILTNSHPYPVRVFCMNCNAGRQWNGGICPHEEERNLARGS